MGYGEEGHSEMVWSMVRRDIVRWCGYGEEEHSEMVWSMVRRDGMVLDGGTCNVVYGDVMWDSIG